MKLGTLKKHFTSCVLLLGTLLVLISLVPAAHAADLFNNFNSGAVVTNTPLATAFTLNQPARINQLVTYHQNGTVGSIRIWTTSRFLIVNLGAQPQPASPGFVDWLVQIPSGLYLPAGTYLLDVSDPATWLHNAQSAGCLASTNPSFQCGFTIVRGDFVSSIPQGAFTGNLKVAQGPPQSQPPSQPTGGNPSPVPYGGNCQGQGCTHPDLRAFGGCAPFPLLPNCIVQVSYNPAAFYWLNRLPPYTSVATLQAQCTQQRGTLVVLEDMYWYYYHSGYYALLGCRR